MPTNAELRAKLQKDVPVGLIVTKEWLTSKGYARHSIDNFVKFRQLVSLRPGVYARPDTNLTWQGIASSLEYMGLTDLHIGGLTAIELHGFSHYVFQGKKQTIHLFGSDPLPSWINQLSESSVFVRHSDTRLFEVSKSKAIHDPAMPPPGAEYLPPITVSTPERAFLEVLYDVPRSVSFEYADQIMQGLATLSPRRLDQLLQRCINIRVKRLFFWYADRYDFSWRKHIDPKKYDLGRGNRVLAKPGKLDPVYAITVPEGMSNG